MTADALRSRIRALLPAGSRVLCAVSGGADSTALLHLLREMGDYSLVCAHFNHGLRGEESLRDEAFVRAMAASFGLEFRAGSADVAAMARQRGKGLEEAARQARYAFLQQTAAACGCAFIATAHTADDNAETVLLRLARGSGARGLSGIPEKRGNVVRPLLHVSRTEILAYLQENGLSHVEDSSNADLSYARNRVRHTVLPALKALNGAAVENLCALAEHLRADEEYLSAMAEDFLQEYRQGSTLPADAVSALPESLAFRVLREMCGGELSSVHFSALRELCAPGVTHAEADLPGMRVVRERERLSFGARTLLPLQRRELRRGETTLLPELGLQVICRAAAPGEEIHNSFNTFYFKSEKIRARMFVAPRAAGSSVRLSGRGCTKSLKKLFAEAKIPLSERDRVPVIYDSEGVAAIRGFGIAERLAATAGEPATVIEFQEMKEEEHHGG